MPVPTTIRFSTLAAAGALAVVLGLVAGHELVTALRLLGLVLIAGASALQGARAAACVVVAIAAAAILTGCTARPIDLVPVCAPAIVARPLPPALEPPCEQCVVTICE